MPSSRSSASRWTCRSPSTANVGVLLPGQNVTFTLQVVNPSTDPASGVVVTDNLPAGLEYVSCTSNLAGICAGAGNNRSISFAQFAPGATATIQIVAKLTATTPGQQITNTATVTAGVLDPVLANNSASANVGVPTLEPTGDADGDGLPNGFESHVRPRPVRWPGSGPADDPDGDGRDEPAGAAGRHASARLRHHLPGRGRDRHVLRHAAGDRQSHGAAGPRARRASSAAMGRRSATTGSCRR